MQPKQEFLLSIIRWGGAGGQSWGVTDLGGRGALISGGRGKKLRKKLIWRNIK